VVTPNEAIAWINSKQRKFNNRVAAFSLCRVSRGRLPRPAHAFRSKAPYSPAGATTKNRRSSSVRSRAVKTENDPLDPTPPARRLEGKGQTRPGWRCGIPAREKASWPPTCQPSCPAVLSKRASAMARSESK
jgi:hypothetical protein